MKRRIFLHAVTGVALLATGSAMADSITKPHTFSSNTVISSSQMNANFDTVYTQVNKVGGAITIDGSNQVGIGTTTPGAKLEVAGQVKITGGTPGAGKVLTSDAAGLAAWAESVSSQWLNGSGSIYYNSGNVGIGTTSPSKKLHVEEGAIFVNAAAEASISLNTSNTIGYFMNHPTTYSGTTAISGLAGLTSNGTGVYLRADNASGIIKLLTGGSNERVRIDSSGNVGIGTTSPTQKLDVAGTIKATSFVGDGSGLTGISGSGLWSSGTGSIYYNSGNVGIGTTSPVVTLELRDSLQSVVRGYAGTSGGYSMFSAMNEDETAEIQMSTYGSTVSHSQFGTTSGNWGVIIAGRSNLNGLIVGTGSGVTGPFILGTNNAERMRITSTGNVGIGTTSPITKLDVNGAMKLAKNSAAPFSCDGAHDGAISLTSNYTTCVCNGSAWVLTADGTTSCVWGTTIVTVTSAGQVWMDRNLGASQVATSSTDEAAYGYLYQWGRGTDGHEKRDSATTSITSSTDAPDHGDFIVDDNLPYDWRDPQNNNLWQGTSGINNPCPDGFRLPTDTELNIEMASWSSNDAEGAFASPLKLVMAGIRERSSGLLLLAGSDGTYWSSTPSGSLTRYLAFSSGGAFVNHDNRAYGHSVRCIKD